jgi:hypothetical protein
VARQSIGRLGNIDAGLVSVNASGVLEGITLPLIWEVFTPRPALNATDGYQTMPPLALRLLRDLNARGFPCHLVVAARLYGESPHVSKGCWNWAWTLSSPCGRTMVSGWGRGSGCALRVGNPLIGA